MTQCCIINVGKVWVKNECEKGRMDFQSSGFHQFLYFVLLFLVVATNAVRNSLPTHRSYSHLPDVWLRAVISRKLYLGTFT